MKDSKGEIEIVAREVEDFCLLEERIYTESFERIQVIEENEEFEKMIPGIYVYVENGEWGSSYGAPIAGLLIEKYLTGKIAPRKKALEKRMLEANLIQPRIGKKKEAAELKD